MTRVEGIANTDARGAVGAALEAARASYEDIASARDELNKLESSGIYAEGYVEEQRQQRADATRQSVERRLATARGRIDSADQKIEQRLAQLTAVDPALLAAAQGQLSLLLGDLREDPNQLLVAYEQSFDISEDRRAIEDLAGRVLRVLPDTPKRDGFEASWERLRERLEDRLPEKQRQLRRGLAELERAREYLGYVAQATTAAIRGLVNPRVGGNLTAYSKTHTYERELSGESAIKDTLPTAAASVQQAL